MPALPGSVPPCGGGTILLVTSNPDSERSLCQTLAEAGYQVDVMSETSMSSAPLARVQLVLLVISSSDCQTDRVCTTSKRKRPELPIIVLGPDVVSTKVRCFDAGADDYVLNPVDGVELVARIKGLIKKR